MPVLPRSRSQNDSNNCKKSIQPRLGVRVFYSISRKSNSSYIISMFLIVIINITPHFIQHAQLWFQPNCILNVITGKVHDPIQYLENPEIVYVV